MGDGSVRFLPATIRPNVLHALIGGDDDDPVQIP